MMGRKDSLFTTRASATAELSSAGQQAFSLKTKLAFILAALALAIGVLAVSPQLAHAETTTDNGVEYTYTTNNDGITIQKIKTFSQDIQIPAQLNGKTVTQIGVGGTKQLGVEGVDALKLNLSDLSSLKRVYCKSSKLIGELELSGCTALEYLDCSSNDLTSLNVPACIELKTLHCESNQLSNTLDVSDCKTLGYLFCNNNKLTAITLPSNSAALREFDCSYNALTSLDVSGQAVLDILRCNNNALTSISGIGTLNSLTELFCANNNLSELDLFHVGFLQTLDCSTNKLTSLDISNHTALSKVICNNNQLQSLNISGAISLTDLNCSSNDLASLDISGLDNLRNLNCSQNNISNVKDLEEWSQETGNSITVLPQKVETNSSNNGNTNNGGIGNPDSTDATVAAKDGKWIHSSKGWWYRYTDGTYAVGLTKIKNTTYYFDANGWMKTG